MSRVFLRRYTTWGLCVLCIVWALIAVETVSAAERAGVTMPESISLGDKTLVLNGLGLREATFLKVDVFVGGLYLEQKTRDPNEIIGSPQTKKVMMHFVRNVDATQLRKAWKTGFAKNAGENLAALSDRVDQLNGWMSTMRVSHEMAFTFDENTVEVNVNGSTLGIISGEDFSRAMLSIWFGPEPPNEGLKLGMLGLDEE